MNEVFKEISQWRIGNVANFTLPRPIKVPVTQPLDVGRSLEMVQIEVCQYVYYIFITWSLWLIRSSSRRADPPNLPDIWGCHPSPMDRKYKSQTHNTICPSGWDTRSRSVGEINNKDNISPAKAGHWAELGKKIRVLIHIPVHWPCIPALWRDCIMCLRFVFSVL